MSQVTQSQVPLCRYCGNEADWDDFDLCENHWEEGTKYLGWNRSNPNVVAWLCAENQYPSLFFNPYES